MLIKPLIPPAERGGRKRTVDEREIVNGIMYVLSTGCQWRYIPEELPPKSTLHDYLSRWVSTDAPAPQHRNTATDNYLQCRELRPPVPQAPEVPTSSRRSRNWLTCTARTS